MKNKKLIFKKILIWLVAILIAAGYWKLSCLFFLNPSFHFYQQDIIPFKMFINLALMGFLFFILLVDVNDNDSDKKTLLSSWKEGKIIIIMIVLVTILFTLLIVANLMFSVIYDVYLTFTYASILLVLGNFLLIFIEYKVYRWWVKTNDTKN